MIDNIRFVVNDRTGVWRDHAQDLQSTGANHFYGHIRNLRISENLDGVTVFGSIPKFINGENITPITKERYADALRQIETTTGFNLKNAYVQRVEFGASLVLKNKSTQYLRLFDAMAGKYKRQRIETQSSLETVNYFTNKGGFAFTAYDKIKELTDTHDKIPNEYMGCNVLRLEYKIQKRQAVKKYLGGGNDITPYDLAASEIYRELSRQFMRFYEKIPKTGRQVFIDASKTITPSELTDLLAKTFLQKHKDEYNEILRHLRERGIVTPKSMERIRSWERKSRADFNISDTNELINELDEKMRQRAYFGA